MTCAVNGGITCDDSARALQGMARRYRTVVKLEAGK